jgi:hypothetical protein
MNENTGSEGLSRQESTTAVTNLRIGVRVLLEKSLKGRRFE